MMDVRVTKDRSWTIIYSTVGNTIVFILSMDRLWLALDVPTVLFVFSLLKKGAVRDFYELQAATPRRSLLLAAFSGYC